MLCQNLTPYGRLRVRHGALGLPVPQRRRRRQGLGGLFEHKLKVKVTLKKNQSALVPIAQTEIEAEKVSLWTGTSGSGRPLRGLWLKNTSPLTLDGGSFSAFENEAFTGEGRTDPIKPGKRRILSYATALGCWSKPRPAASHNTCAGQRYCMA